MGVMIDSGVFIRWERLGRRIDFSRWGKLGEPLISVVTASELLVGVHRADSLARQTKRRLFVDGVLSSASVVGIDLATARIHASILAELSAKGIVIGAHDFWIAAAALRYECSILTTNAKEFSRVPNLNVVEFVEDA